MAFLPTYEVAQSRSFRARVAVALMKCAAYVAGEDRTALPVAKASKRYQLATDTMLAPEGRLNQWVWVLLANDAIAAKGMDATDDELLGQAYAAWNIVAGVTLEDEAAPVVEQGPA
jgi:hypothetical protein